MADLLWKHQREALRRMHIGCVLCGAPGSGKSMVGIAFAIETITGHNFESGKSAEKPTTLYIITTATKRDSLDWQGELARFGLTPKEPTRGISCVVDSWNNIRKYEKSKGFFIFDEQRLVGRGAWAKAYRKIASRNPWILLSGTPGDTWMDYLQVFLGNGFYRNQTEFAEKHVEYDRFARYPKVKRYHNEKLLRKHRDAILVRMPMERRTRRHEQRISCKYETETYNETLRQRWDVLRNRPIEDAAGLARALRYIVVASGDRRGALLRLLAARKRAIVFYMYNYERDILRDVCEALARPWGEMNGTYHDEVPQGDEWAYLVQYTSGAEAWNCVTCDTIIFYSESYSWKQVEQAKGRIDRANTPYKDLYYITLTSESGFDRAVERALKRKERFNEAAFGRR
jgi:hypothetical protein